MENVPNHIAIIMDGNRRWAKEKGLTPTQGHKAGAENLENIAKICNEIGVRYLTVYAFSTENWKRNKDEVSALMALLKLYLNSVLKNANIENIKIKVLGDITILSKSLQNSINKVVEKTKNNTGLTLNIAFNYGGRTELIYAMKNIAKQVKEGKIEIDEINEKLISDNLYTSGQPEPDLLIRTSKELRTSNFLPWQLVYSEFYFPDVHWPAFDRDELIKAIEEFNRRNRRYGGN